MELQPKIEAFRDLEYLTQVLSMNGIGNFRPWRSDGYKWITFSDYKTFGTKTGFKGTQNNIAYYISSDTPDFAQEIKLVLNINNTDENKEAIETFIRIALKTFSALNVQPPNHMLTSILRGEQFHYEDEQYSTTLKILKTNIFTWSLVVTSK